MVPLMTDSHWISCSHRCEASTRESSLEMEFEWKRRLAHTRSIQDETLHRYSSRRFVSPSRKTKRPRFSEQWGSEWRTSKFLAEASRNCTCHFCANARPSSVVTTLNREKNWSSFDDLRCQLTVLLFDRFYFRREPWGFEWSHWSRESYLWSSRPCRNSADHQRHRQWCKHHCSRNHCDSMCTDRNQHCPQSTNRIVHPRTHIDVEDLQFETIWMQTRRREMDALVLMFGSYSVWNCL